MFVVLSDCTLHRVLLFCTSRNNGWGFLQSYILFKEVLQTFIFIFSMWKWIFLNVVLFFSHYEWNLIYLHLRKMCISSWETCQLMFFAHFSMRLLAFLKQFVGETCPLKSFFPVSSPLIMLDFFLTCRICFWCD